MKKALLVSVLLAGMMLGCSQQSQPTEHYVLKYYIDYDNKVLKVRFSDDFKGNKTIACEQLTEMKDITDYSINIYKWKDLIIWVY